MIRKKTMEIKRITLSKTVQIKQFEPLVVTTEAEILEGDNIMDSYYQLAELTAKAFYKAKQAQKAVDDLVKGDK